MMNSHDMAHMMSILQAAYPYASVTDEQMELWHNAFASSDTNIVLDAARRWIENEEHWPTIAGIRSKMRESRAHQARELAYTARPDPIEQSITPKEGRAIASASYVTDCEERGVEPNWGYFDYAIGGVGAAK